jgi:hypothetical protein
VWLWVEAHVEEVERARRAYDGKLSPSREPRD